MIAAVSEVHQPDGVAHLAGPLEGRVQRCSRCSWEFDIQAPRYMKLDPMQFQEGVEVEHRTAPNSDELRPLEPGDRSGLPRCVGKR